MKRLWTNDDLVAQWTLQPDELVLVEYKEGANRLGFALLLKYFQIDGRFPRQKHDVPVPAIAFVANQIDVSIDLYPAYDWEGRTIKQHRADIRAFVGFRESTVQDYDEMIATLLANDIPKDHQIEHLKAIVYIRFRTLQIEPPTPEGNERINRINYEIAVLQVLRHRLRCKEIWVEGAKKFGNPDRDLPQDFRKQRATYYEALALPQDKQAFIDDQRRALQDALALLNTGLATKTNKTVEIQTKDDGWIAVTPLEPQPEPTNLARLKAEVALRWPMIRLLDILKETDLRVSFTDQFKSSASREQLDRATIRRRLLLCLYGLGTNTGLKRMSGDEQGECYSDLLYVRRRFITKDHLRAAIVQVVNAILQTRLPHIWGEGTTTCASDSKKFGAWDQNLMTEWHIRYRGPGIMVYWHVEKKSACIYSQLKSCSSSEVAAMIEGVLRHCTEMEVEKQYVDSRGQSEVAFAFTHLLGFELMPRLKRIHKQILWRPEPRANEAYPELQPVLSTRAILWDLIAQQYDEMVKYATAMRLGTADAEAILRRFTRSDLQHPTYAALAELGKVRKTIVFETSGCITEQSRTGNATNVGAVDVTFHNVRYHALYSS